MDDCNPLAIQIRRTKLLSEDEIAGICNHFKNETIPKNRFFIESGNRCSRVGYLVSGIMCSFIISEKGEEVVKYFIEPDQFFTDLESYERLEPAMLNIKAVTDSRILYITREENQKLQSQYSKWGQVLGIFASTALNKMIQTKNFLHFGTAKDKYRHFVRNHPNLARQVPLKYIASYLGITHSSLSRLRRENY